MGKLPLDGRWWGIIKRKRIIFSFTLKMEMGKSACRVLQKDAYREMVSGWDGDGGERMGASER